jgi:hypothetical protein
MGSSHHLEHIRNDVKGNFHFLGIGSVEIQPHTQPIASLSNTKGHCN